MKIKSFEFTDYCNYENDNYGYSIYYRDQFHDTPGGDDKFEMQFPKELLESALLQVDYNNRTFNNGSKIVKEKLLDLSGEIEKKLHDLEIHISQYNTKWGLTK